MAGSAALLMIMPTQNPALSDGLMYFVLTILALQGMIASACVVAGIWPPARRWLGAPARRR